VTGVLGIQPQPTVGEAAGWLLYAVPMLVFVLWPAGRRPSLSRKQAAGLAAGALCVLALAACGGGSNGSGSKDAQSLKVTLTDAGCSPTKLTAKSGPITFNVENGGTAKVSELELKSPSGLILGERENIVGGISGSFSLVLQPGRYVLSCPNGDQEDNGVLVVTGKAAPASTADAKLVAAATTGYKRYVERESGELVKKTTAFVAALRRGDIEQAKALFGPTRYHYEAIEPVAESFGSLDPEIDARENDVENPKDWTGFHRIEKILWVDGTTHGTDEYAKKLLADVKTLNTRVHTLNFQAAQLANGAVELLNEVAGSKITGEEDRYSHTDLSDFAGNLEGARQAFDLLRPALRDRGDGELVTTIDDRFADVSKGLDRYKRPTALGYALYSALTPADRRTLAHQIDALAEPLSTVAAEVST
jgi:iron uptake system component EfeO